MRGGREVKEGRRQEEYMIRYFRIFGSNSTALRRTKEVTLEEHEPSFIRQVYLANSTDEALSKFKLERVG